MSWIIVQLIMIMVQSAAIYPSDESSPYQNALRPLVQEYVDNRYKDLGWAE